MAFVEGHLDDGESSAIESHLDRCAACRKITATMVRESRPADVGNTIGRYVILERVGAGAMGVIYSAWDPQLDRRVAIKLLHPTRQASPSMRARMLREAQAMARLNSPHVVTVHDAGTIDEQVYIVMEFVDGTTLSVWLNEKPRSVREILSRFRDAGRGLAAAHRAGLIHRDFKPQNVLCRAGDGRVLVSDFGLVRSETGSGDGSAAPSNNRAPDSEASSVTQDTATAPQPTHPATILTHSRVRLGTPAYMAPEQHAGRVADARADQFSFCVALYEGLYGERPFSGTQLESVAAAATLGTIRAPARRRRVPARIRRALLRGLRAEPADRHANMDRLLESLGPGRRLVWSAIVAMLVVVGIGAAVWPGADGQPVCQGAERKLAGVWDDDRRRVVHDGFLHSGVPYALDAWTTVSAMLDRYSVRWIAAHTEACEATRVTGEQSEDLLDRRMDCLARRLQGLDTLTRVLAHGDREVIQYSVAAANALGDLEGCANVHALGSRSPLPTDPVARAEIAAVRQRLANGKVLHDAGRYADGMRAADAGLAAALATRHGSLEAEARYLVGLLKIKLGRNADAEQDLYRAAWRADALQEDELAANAWLQLVYVVGYRQHKFAQAEQCLEQAAAKVERLGSNDKLTASIEASRGTLSLAQDRLADSLAHYERSLASDSAVASTLANLCIAHRRLADYPKAQAACERALLLQQRTLGADHPDVAIDHRNLGRVFEDQRRYEAAMEQYQRAYEIARRLFGERNIKVAYARADLGNILDQLGRLAEAEREERAALAIKEELEGPHARTVAVSLINLATILNHRGSDPEALGHWQRALSILEKTVGMDNRDAAVCLTGLGTTLLSLGHPADARTHNQRALAIIEKIIGPDRRDHPDLCPPLLGLGESEVALGNPAGAIAALERALAICGGDLAPLDRSDAQFALARALWETGNRARAIQLAETAEATDRAGGERGRAALSRVIAWLNRHRKP